MKRLSQAGSFQEEKSYLANVFGKHSQLRFACLKGTNFEGAGGFLLLFDNEPREDDKALSLTAVNTNL